ncbi:MAG: LCCL domain-containing protein [Kofleriaceae bacterium]
MKPEDKKVLWIVAGIFVIAFGVGVPLMYIADDAPTPHAQPPKAPKGETNCPLDFSTLAFDDHEATCWCDGDFASTEVAIGTAQYHQLSNPCAAAIHAGALSRYGSGRVTFATAPGCAAYTATEFNRQRSMSLQESDATRPSYIVVGHGHPGCSQSFNF